MIFSLSFIIYGRLFSTGEQSAASGLGRCEHVPCFRGITPGKSSWADALAVLGGQAIVTRDSAYTKIALFPCANGHTVASILLDRPLDSSVTVAKMIALYGTPSYLDVYAKSGLLLLHFPSAHVSARFEGSQFKSSAHVLAILLGDSVDDFAHPSPQCGGTPSDVIPQRETERAWLGFASMERYLRAH